MIFIIGCLLTLLLSTLSIDGNNYNDHIWYSTYQLYYYSYELCYHKYEWWHIVINGAIIVVNSVVMGSYYSYKYHSYITTILFLG